MAAHRGFSFSRVGITLLATALALIMTGTATSVAAASPDAPESASFLALGDSVVFGYITQAGYAYVNADNFVSYPDYAGAALRLDAANAACPGETTGSFIAGTVPDNGCQDFRAHAPLHVAYRHSQLDFATRFLATHRHTRLVTISLGANDIFLLQQTCAGDLACIQAGLPAVLASIGSNMDTILQRLRATGFRGVVMVVNYYSPDYTDPVETGVIAALNDVLATIGRAHGAVVADAFKAFQRAASTPFAGGETCKAGLLNVNPQNQLLCDVHPSQSGQQLLAGAVQATYRTALRAHGDY